MNNPTRESSSWDPSIHVSAADIAKIASWLAGSGYCHTLLWNKISKKTNVCLCVYLCLWDGRAHFLEQSRLRLPIQEAEQRWIHPSVGFWPVVWSANDCKIYRNFFVFVCFYFCPPPAPPRPTPLGSIGINAIFASSKNRLIIILLKFYLPPSAPLVLNK